MKGMTVGIGVDTKEFDKGIKKMDQKIRQTNKEIRTLAKSLQIDFDAGRFKRAQEKAQKAIQQTDEKAKVLKERLQFLEQEGKVNTNEYEELKNKLVDTESKAVLLKRQLQEIKDMKVDQLAKKFEVVGGGITKAGQSMKALSTVATAMLASFGAIGLSTIKYADDLKTMADQLNLSANTLQRWQYIAMQTDVTNEQLQNAFIRVQSALSGVATGELDVMSEALVDLGITAEQASLGMEANFEDIVIRIAEMKDETLQAYYANEIFGKRMGAQLIPLLKSGSEGFATLSAEFEEFGALSNEQIGDLADFDNVMNRIKFTFETIKNQLGSALLPVMEHLADVIQNQVAPVIQRLSEWFSDLTLKQKETILSVLAFTAMLAPTLLIVGKMVSGIGGLVRGVGSLGKALTVLMAHPIIAIIAVVVGLLIALYTTNEDFRKSVNNLVGTLMGSLGPILKTVVNALGGMLKAIMPLVNLIAKLLIPVIDLLAKAFAKQFGFIGKVVEFVVKGIEWYINGVIKVINFLIRQINKLGDVFDFQIKELENVSLTGKIEGPEEVLPQEKATQTPDELVSKTTYESTPTSIVNNDYSDKEIKIEIVVQNYAENIDVDDLARQVNLKLAQEL